MSFSQARCICARGGSNCGKLYQIIVHVIASQVAVLFGLKGGIKCLCKQINSKMLGGCYSIFEGIVRKPVEYIILSTSVCGNFNCKRYIFYSIFDPN